MPRKREIFKIDYSYASRGKPPITRDELAMRLRLIPQDTRDITAKLCGDPIPGDLRREMFPGEA